MGKRENEDGERITEEGDDEGSGDDGSGVLANKIPEQKRKIERPIGLPLVNFFGGPTRDRKVNKMETDNCM